MMMQNTIRMETIVQTKLSTFIISIRKILKLEYNKNVEHVIGLRIPLSFPFFVE